MAMTLLDSGNLFLTWLFVARRSLPGGVLVLSGDVLLGSLLLGRSGLPAIAGSRGL